MGQMKRAPAVVPPAAAAGRLRGRAGAGGRYPRLRGIGGTREVAQCGSGKGDSTLLGRGGPGRGCNTFLRKFHRATSSEGPGQKGRAGAEVGGWRAKAYSQVRKSWRELCLPLCLPLNLPLLLSLTLFFPEPPAATCCPQGNPRLSNRVNSRENPFPALIHSLPQFHPASPLAIAHSTSVAHHALRPRHHHRHSHCPHRFLGHLARWTQRPLQPRYRP